jgi:perosamine synthetase
MRVINENAKGICFVVDAKNSLLGVVTDGDIRRAQLNGVKVHAEIKNILSKQFSYGYVDESYNELISKITHKVAIIPLVDSNLRVVDFFEYKQRSHFPVAIPNLNGNEFQYLTDAFLSTWISSQGEYINRFEDGFSNYCDSKYGVAVSNGTVALHLALITLGIGKDDEVIVPDLTFAATINTVLHANATPVIVDVEESSWCIDPKKIEKAITAKTKAIIAVHIYGQVCNVGAIKKIAKIYNLKLIEDCAEAHGAIYDGRKVGSFGDIGCFSFYGNKVITTGEGGMCVTNDLELDEKMRVLRDHGMSKTKRYWHDVIGYNYRMTNIQAAIGLAQLERIENIHKNRREYEENYKSVLNKNTFTFQADLKGRTRITWLVSVVLDEAQDREMYIQLLKEKGIDARPFFYPLSDMDIYKSYCKHSTPVTHRLSRSGLNLPTYESLKSMDEITKILNVPI